MTKQPNPISLDLAVFDVYVNDVRMNAFQVTYDEAYDLAMALTDRDFGTEVKVTVRHTVPFNIGE